MGNATSRPDEGGSLYLRDQTRLSLSSLVVSSPRRHSSINITPNGFPASRVSASRPLGDNSPIEFVQDPEPVSSSASSTSSSAASPNAPPSFLLKLYNEEDLTFTFTFVIRQTPLTTAAAGSAGGAAAPDETAALVGGLRSPSSAGPVVDTQINGLTFVYASSAREVENLVTREFHADPNLHKNSNVELVGDFATGGSPSVSFNWTWKWRPPRAVEDRGGGWRTSCSFVEYDQRAHRLHTLASFSFWVSNPTAYLSHPNSPTPPFLLNAPPKIRVASVQSVDSRLSSSGAEAADEPGSPRTGTYLDPGSAVGLGLSAPTSVPSQPPAEPVKIDVSCARPGDDVAVADDGPVFRATIKALEQKTGNMRTHMKRVIKKAEHAHATLIEANDAFAGFIEALKEASSTNANAVQPAIDHYFDKIAREILSYERLNTANLQRIIIEPLARLYTWDIKQAEAKKRDFEEESKDYYSYVGRYLGQRHDSVKAKKLAESDTKYQTKRRNFELKRFDYSSFMQDLSGGRKEQEVLSHLTRYADAQARSFLKTAQKVDNLLPQLEALTNEVQLADKEYQYQRREREEKRRLLEKSNAASVDPGDPAAVAPPPGTAAANGSYASATTSASASAGAVGLTVGPGTAASLVGNSATTSTAANANAHTATSAGASAGANGGSASTAAGASSSAGSTAMASTLSSAATTASQPAADSDLGRADSTSSTLRPLASGSSGGTLSGSSGVAGGGGGAATTTADVTRSPAGLGSQHHQHHTHHHLNLLHHHTSVGSPPQVSKFKGIRDLEERDPAQTAALEKNGSPRKEGLLWALNRPGSHVDPRTALNKQGWHKFWIVLDQGKLSEYSNWKQKLDLHMDPIDLRMASVREARNAERRFCFEVITPQFKRVYQATSEEDMNSWISSINNALQSAVEGRGLRDKPAHVVSPVTGSPAFPGRDIGSILTGKSISLTHGHRGRDNLGGGGVGGSSGVVAVGASGSGGQGGSSSTGVSAAASGMPTRRITVGGRPGTLRRSHSSSFEEAPDKLLQMLRDNDQGNCWCADCGSGSKVEWVSINLAIILCIECSGIHRSLGTHISKVRSLTLDITSFTPDIVELLLQVGNRVANMVWEARLGALTGAAASGEAPTAAAAAANLPHKPGPQANREQRLRYITAKYVDRAFVEPISATLSRYPTADETLLAAIKKNEIQQVIYALALRANPNATDKSRGTHAVFLALAAADPATPSPTSTPYPPSSSSSLSSLSSSSAVAARPAAAAAAVAAATAGDGRVVPFATAELLLQNGAEIPPTMPAFPLSRSAQLYLEAKRGRSAAALGLGLGITSGGLSAGGSGRALDASGNHSAVTGTAHTGSSGAMGIGSGNGGSASGSTGTATNMSTTAPAVPSALTAIDRMVREKEARLQKRVSAGGRLARSPIPER